MSEWRRAKKMAAHQACESARLFFCGLVLGKYRCNTTCVHHFLQFLDLLLLWFCLPRSMTAVQCLPAESFLSFRQGRIAFVMWCGGAE